MGRVVSCNKDWTGDVTSSVTFWTGSKRLIRLATMRANAAKARKPVQTSVRAVNVQQLSRRRITD
jgi:hypothetical protein